MFDSVLNLFFFFFGMALNPPNDGSINFLPLIQCKLCNCNRKHVFVKGTELNSGHTFTLPM